MIPKHNGGITWGPNLSYESFDHPQDIFYNNTVPIFEDCDKITPEIQAYGWQITQTKENVSALEAEQLGRSSIPGLLVVHKCHHPDKNDCHWPIVFWPHKTIHDMFWLLIAVVVVVVKVKHTFISLHL